MEPLTSTAKGTFRGLAVVFGAPDSGASVFAPGAFSKALAVAAAEELATHQRKPLCALAWFGAADPIGVVTAARETKDGLEIEAECDLGTERGRRAFSGIRMGYITSLSLDAYATKVSGRVITEAALGLVRVGLLGYGADTRTAVYTHSVKTLSIPPSPALTPYEQKLADAVELEKWATLRNEMAEWLRSLR